MARQCSCPRIAGIFSAKFSIVVLLYIFTIEHTGCHEQGVPSGKTPPPELKMDSLYGLHPLGLITEITRQSLESIVGENAVETAFENAVLYLESVFGQENIYTIGMFIAMLVQFVAEGAASGLNVIAVYVSEILRATGIDAKLPFPHFTPEGVTSVAKWALAALVCYWLLSIVLRLAVSILRRVFWLLKAVATLWLFGLIVSDTKASTDTTAMRLGFLVVGYVVISLMIGGGVGSSLEGRLASLEGKVKAIEKKKMD